jgi:hypothetical protein
LMLGGFEVGGGGGMASPMLGGMAVT